MSIHARAALCASACLLTSSAALASPLSYVTANGYADSTASIGGLFGEIYNEQRQEFGSPVGTVPSGFTGRADTAARGDFHGLQAADTTATVGIRFGSMHGSAIGDATIGDAFTTSTESHASAGGSWYDSITFHTTDRAGADFRYALTLDDALSTSVTPGLSGYYTNGSSVSAAQTFLNVVGSDGFAVAQIDLEDRLQQEGSRNGIDPGPTTHTSPAERTQSRTLHVQDGDTFTFYCVFGIGIDVINVNGTASAIALDTAYFNLAALTDGAWYTADSGTLYATSGDPDRPDAPGNGQALPEPSSIALGFAGTAALLGLGHRRRARGRTPAVTGAA